ncbi:MAG: hypothetical protein ABII07_00695 [Patescibacteria group bacterium]|nr:hypothetical protein [Patescibacteria group bacterium]
MDTINSLSMRAKIAIIVVSIFLVSLTIGLLVFGGDLVENDQLHINTLHKVTHDMVLTHGE